MKTKHTNGTWITEGVKIVNSNIVAQVSTDNGFTLVSDTYGLSIEETEANAKLIASAPELLKALNLMVNNFTDNSTGAKNQAILKAKAIIKKITE